MRLELTRIGNSRGIRIPKPLIAQCGLSDVVEARVTPEGLVIAPHLAPRHAWNHAFPASRLPKQDGAGRAGSTTSGRSSAPGPEAGRRLLQGSESGFQRAGGDVCPLGWWPQRTDIAVSTPCGRNPTAPPESRLPALRGGAAD